MCFAVLDKAVFSCGLSLPAGRPFAFFSAKKEKENTGRLTQEAQEKVEKWAKQSFFCAFTYLYGLYLGEWRLFLTLESRQILVFPFGLECATGTLK